MKYAWTIVLVAGIGAFAYLQLCGSSRCGLAAQRPGPGRADAGGPQARAFQAATLSGHSINFPSDYKGKLVLVDFWATWCGPCRVEIPHLVAAYEKYHGRGLEIVGVTLDEVQRVPRARVEQYVKEQKMPWEQVYRGARGIAGAYGVNAIPTAFLVDGDTGVILAQGSDLYGVALYKAIESNLKDGSN
ncbi:MAG: TlpA family protein disulfide reductase [Phycisphaerae bacterium]|nr:TlpA family protein disulfide reductase [Phycisphaerae bacterium]